MKYSRSWLSVVDGDILVTCGYAWSGIGTPGDDGRHTFTECDVAVIVVAKGGADVAPCDPPSSLISLREAPPSGL